MPNLGGVFEMLNSPGVRAAAGQSPLVQGAPAPLPTAGPQATATPAPLPTANMPTGTSTPNSSQPGGVYDMFNSPGMQSGGSGSNASGMSEFTYSPTNPNENVRNAMNQRYTPHFMPLNGLFGLGRQ